MVSIALSLLAAATFALSALLIGSLSGKVGVFQLARWQMGVAFVLTAAASLALGGWHTITLWQFGMLAASSAAGIMLASTTYFAAIYAAGPRLTALLFSLASPFALGLGYVFLGETVNASQGVGIALILLGIILAIAMHDSDGDAAPTRPLWQGVALGVITALGQSTGSLLSRPAMMSGVEPFTATAIRSGLGLVFFVALAAFAFGRDPRPMARRDAVTVGASAFFGMVLGMSLLMAALVAGDVGIVTTLSSTTPILILPLIWITARRAPGIWAWAGAALAVAGTALIGLGA